MFQGPGHGSVVEDGAGCWWLVYVVWRTGQWNTWPPGRLMMLDRITWLTMARTMNSDGQMSLGKEGDSAPGPYMGIPRDESR